MAVVYVVQRQLRYDSRRRGMVPRFDLEPARQHGRLEFLLGPDAGPGDPEGVLGALHERLRDATAEDFLLLVGNPCLIGWAAAIFADLTGRLNMLQWHTREKRYVPVQSVVFTEEE